MTRAELEQDCDFLGLIIMQVLALIVTLMLTNLFQNLLKKETFGAIAELHQVRFVRSVETRHVG